MDPQQELHQLHAQTHLPEPEQSKLSPLAELVITTFEKEQPYNDEAKIMVNPVVAKFASWYEKVRNAMEYREDEVMLRSTIQRILTRRLLLGGNAKTTAEPLVRELIWARYLSDNAVPVSVIHKVEHSISLYLNLRLQILHKHRLPESTINEWIYHLMSSDIEHILHPSLEKETIGNFMFQILKEQVHITDDAEQTRDAQVYIAVRRAFARDDLAFLRYHLFKLYFGHLTEHNLDHVSEKFTEGFKEINAQLAFPRRDRIYAYVKKRTAAFLILEDLLEQHKTDVRELVQDEERLEQVISTLCEKRYNSIASKVRRAVIRSVLFVLFSKVMFAFFVEGTYERIMYGEIMWTSIIINTSIPPILMVIVSLFIRTPGSDNTKRIFTYIRSILYNDHPKLGHELTVQKKPSRSKPVLNTIFTVLWLLAFVISFGSVIYVLHLLHFTFISTFIFIFFLAIVSFLSYRISLTANIYTVGDRQGLITPLVDFLFMPVVRVGRKLTQEIGRFNVFLMLFDFLIETPFKILFAFFEQWFLFLHAKREELE